MPQCVEPFTGDNGGATATGVTADEVKIVYYQSDPALDPLGASMVAASGADVDPASGSRAVGEYTDLYNSIFETYGRTGGRRELHRHRAPATTARPPGPTPSPSPSASRSP